MFCERLRNIAGNTWRVTGSTRRTLFIAEETRHFDICELFLAEEHKSIRGVRTGTQKRRVCGQTSADSHVYLFRLIDHRRENEAKRNFVVRDGIYRQIPSIRVNKRKRLRTSN